MPRILKRLSVAGLAALFAVAGCAKSDDPGVLPKDARSDIGVQLFQFTWNSVAQQCTDTLGPAGYGWVLVSPASEPRAGTEWWNSYQVISYKIESRLGTRDEFKSMVDTCRAAGVEVYADAVVNHMSGFDSGKGFAGSTFTHYDYPGIWTEDDFHKCDTSNGDIQDYMDATQVQTCELDNLADLKTEEESVRAKLRAYLADLVSLGVGGFRIDAAKHMAAADVEAIVSELPTDVRVISEVIRSSAEPIQPDDYLGAGDVYEFQYSKDMRGVLGGTAFSQFAKMITAAPYLADADAVPFITNHDTERNGQSLNYKAGGKYVVATALMVAQDYGTPQVYSGYAFSERDTGPVTEDDGSIADATCGAKAEEAADGQFVCSFADPLVVATVKLAARDADGAGELVYGEGDVAVLKRGEGALVANRGFDAFTGKVTTGLAPGKYCDIVHDTECTSPVTVADDGALDVTLAATDGLVLLPV